MPKCERLFERARQVVLERRTARLAEEAGRRIVATDKVDSAPSGSSVPDQFQRVKKTHQLQGVQTDLPLDRDGTIRRAQDPCSAPRSAAASDSS